MHVMVARATGAVRVGAGAALKRIRTRLGTRRSVIALLTRAGPPLVATGVALHVVAGLLPIAFILLTGAALGHVGAAVHGGTGSPAAHALQVDLLVAAGVLAVTQALVPVQLLVQRRIWLRVDAEMFDRLLVACMSSPRTAPLEDPSIRARIDEAVAGLRNWRNSPGSAAAAVLAVLTRYTTFAGATLVVALRFDAVAAAVLVVGGLALRLAHRHGFTRYVALATGQAPSTRRASYLRELALGTAVAKEARVFALAPWLADRTADAVRSAREPVWRERPRIYIKPFVHAGLVSTAAAALALGWLGAAAARDGMPPGRLILVTQAAIAVLAIGTHFEDADALTEWGTRTVLAVQAVEQVLGDAGRVADRAAASAPGAQEAGPLPVGDISWHDVRFSYPGAGAPVLDGFALTVRAGTSVALVGLNGAGKTTALKLLCGFHKPDSGAITVGGVDIGTLDAARWQRAVAAIFQNFGRYELSAEDNIAFGAAEKVGDTQAVRTAAERAGAADFLSGLDQGFQTVLSRSYAAGTDLSGGQWQRVALARALLAVQAGASILLLDEPTANLDVRAEAAFIDNFLTLTRGVTTIVVSHRFSTVRMVDRIVVLDGGRIVEDGSHAELMARRGRYADMFDLQAMRFADEGRSVTDDGSVTDEDRAGPGAGEGREPTAARDRR